VVVDTDEDEVVDCGHVAPSRDENMVIMYVE
jgi:hypothetical protein